MHFNLLNFMKTRPNMTNTTLKRVSPWHFRLEIYKINGKIGFSFESLLFSWVNNQVIFTIFLIASELTEFEKVWNSGKICYKHFFISSLVDDFWPCAYCKKAKVSMNIPICFWPRTFYLTGGMRTSIHLVEARWSDDLVKFFFLMHRCGIN